MPRAASRRTLLVRFLDDVSQPVYFVDRNRQILFCNEALAKMLRQPVDEIVGASCGYHSQPSDLSGLNGLCPPESAFHDSISTGIVHVPATAGSEPRSAQFCSMLGGNDADPVTLGLMVVIGDGLASQANAQYVRGFPSELVVEPNQLHAELWRLRSELRREFQIDSLIGRSAAMGRVREQVKFAAECPFSVLVCGPVGSGRERVARTVHAIGPSRISPPLIPLAATVLDAELLRTTIDAFIKRFAELETDQGPTLLLLDSDQLAEDAQVELLGFMAIDELGLRTLATTCTPLIDLARDGKFHPLLAQRLSTMVIDVPDLRNRPEDIPLLVQFYVEQLNELERRHVDGVSPDAVEQLMAFPWSRNVDELKDVVAEAYAQSQHATIEGSDLPAKIRLGVDAVLQPRAQPASVKLMQHLEEVERSLIRSALERCDGNKTQAAKLLSISRGRLLRRIDQLKITEANPS